MGLLSGVIIAYLWLAAVIAPLMILELLFPKDPQSAISRLQGAVFWAVGVPFGSAISAGCFLILRHVGLKPIVVFDLKFLGPVLGFFLACLIRDFTFYWMHRAQHRFFWRFHSVHHSIEELNVVAYYHHVTEAFFGFTFMTLPVLLFVTDFQGAVWVGAFATVQGTFLHANTRLHLGPLRYLLCDNRYHRIHHSREPRHFDKNFGAFSPLWDVVFRTAYFPKAGEWPATGVAGRPEPTTVLDLLAAPFRPDALPAAEPEPQRA